MARKGQDFHFSFSLGNQSQKSEEYCLEYNSDKNVTLRYLTSYNYCDAEHCFPSCLNYKITNADKTKGTRRLTVLIPLDMTERGKMSKLELSLVFIKAVTRACKSFLHCLHFFIFFDRSCYHSFIF